MHTRPLFAAYTEKRISDRRKDAAGHLRREANGEKEHREPCGSDTAFCTISGKNGISPVTASPKGCNEGSRIVRNLTMLFTSLFCT